jgi:hypothetical protein
MKRLILAVAVCCTFSTYVTAMDTNNNYMEDYVLRTLIENDTNDIKEVIRNSCTEADKTIFEADKAYYKAGTKNTQSRKIFVTKADVLKMCSIEADKARGEAYEAYGKARAAKSDHDSTAKVKKLSALYDTADANAAKAYGILTQN